MWWRWTTVVLLTMVPALIGGQSAGIAAGLAYGFDPVPLLVVVCVTSFLSGLLLMRLTELSLHIPPLRRMLQRFHTPRAIAWCTRWGPWGGLTLGAAVVGPEPILVSLKYMTVKTHQIVLPLAVSSVGFTVLYYVIVSQGIAQSVAISDDLRLLFGMFFD